MGWSFEVLQPSLIELLDRAVVRSAVVEQHEALLACIEARDAIGAQRAMRAHLLLSAQRVARRQGACGRVGSGAAQREERFRRGCKQGSVPVLAKALMSSH